MTTQIKLTKAQETTFKAIAKQLHSSDRSCVEIVGSETRVFDSGDICANSRTVNKLIDAGLLIQETRFKMAFMVSITPAGRKWIFENAREIYIPVETMPVLGNKPAPVPTSEPTEPAATDDEIRKFLETWMLLSSPEEMSSPVVDKPQYPHYPYYITNPRDGYPMDIAVTTAQRNYVLNHMVFMDANYPASHVIRIFSAKEHARFNQCLDELEANPPAPKGKIGDSNHIPPNTTDKWQVWAFACGWYLFASCETEAECQEYIFDNGVPTKVVAPAPMVEFPKQAPYYRQITREEYIELYRFIRKDTLLDENHYFIKPENWRDNFQDAWEQGIEYYMDNPDFIGWVNDTRRYNWQTLVYALRLKNNKTLRNLPIIIQGRK